MDRADLTTCSTRDLLAQEIADDLQTALEQFSAVVEGLNG